MLLIPNTSSSTGSPQESGPLADRNSSERRVTFPPSRHRGLSAGWMPPLSVSRARAPSGRNWDTAWWIISRHLCFRSDWTKNCTGWVMPRCKAARPKPNQSEKSFAWQDGTQRLLEPRAKEKEHPRRARIELVAEALRYLFPSANELTSLASAMVAGIQGERIGLAMPC